MISPHPVPEERRGSEWDEWCRWMVRDCGYAASYVAAVARVARSDVERAVTRAERGDER